MDRRLLMTVSLATCCLSAPFAHALNTTDAEPELLKAYATTLSKNVADSHLQLMWAASRKEGYFYSNSPVFFTTEHNKLPELVTNALSNPTSVTPYQTTRATYRYDSTQPVGINNKVAVTAICIDVDWRTLPAGTATDDAGRMKGVSLLLAKPCP